MIQERNIKEIVKEELLREQNLQRAFPIVWGQCTHPMKTNLRSQTEFKKIDEKSDAIELIKLTKRICYSFEDNRYSLAAVYLTIDRFVNFWQGENEADTRYLELFNNAVKGMESMKITISSSEEIIKQEFGNISSKSQNKQKIIQEEVSEIFLAYNYVKGIDRLRYMVIQEDLHNKYLKGQKNYPASITAAYELQTGYWKKAAKSNTGNDENNPKSSISFLNKNMSNVTCYNCCEKERIATYCPKKKASEESKNNLPASTNQLNEKQNNNKSDGKSDKKSSHFSILTFTFAQRAEKIIKLVPFPQTDHNKQHITTSATEHGVVASNMNQ